MLKHSSALLAALVALSVSSEANAQKYPASSKAPVLGKAPPKPENSQVDYSRFLEIAKKVEPIREKRLLTEEEFLAMAKEPGTIVLDTRSAAAYAEVHVKGAVHLNFSDITQAKLEKALGDKRTRVLIYCNNNFENAPPALAVKTASAALNIPTFITLYEYGYRNIYELGPVIDASKSKLPLVSSQPSTAKSAAGYPTKAPPAPRSKISYGKSP